MKLPVRLVFVRTVHKVQGKTLSKVVLDVGSNYLSTGQLQVAFSRVRKSGDILFMHNTEDTPQETQKINPRTISIANHALKEAGQFP